MHDTLATKDALVKEALHVAMDHVEAPPHTGSLRGDLLALARAVAAFVTSPMGTAVVRLLFTDGGNSALRALALASYQERGRHLPRTVLERAAARGELIDDDAISQVLFMIAGSILHRVFVERAPADDPFLARVVDLLLGGAAPPPRRRRVATPSS